MERKTKKSQEIDINAKTKKTPWWKFGEKIRVRKMNKAAEEKFNS